MPRGLFCILQRLLLVRRSRRRLGQRLLFFDRLSLRTRRGWIGRSQSLLSLQIYCPLRRHALLVHSLIFRRHGGVGGPRLRRSFLDRLGFFWRGGRKVCRLSLLQLQIVLPLRGHAHLVGRVVFVSGHRGNRAQRKCADDQCSNQLVHQFALREKFISIGHLRPSQRRGRRKLKKRF